MPGMVRQGGLLMRSEKSRTAARTSARRAVYRQGTKQVRVESLDNTFAVRYREGAGAVVSEALRAQGQVRAIEPQRLLIVEFPDAARRAAALRQLNRWTDEGLVEFVTPVLRDAESQLRQILTDEITVRFKSTLPSQQLAAVEQEYGVTVARQNEFVPTQFIFKVSQPKGLDTLDIASRLDAADDVEFATPNFISEYQR